MKIATIGSNPSSKNANNAEHRKNTSFKSAGGFLTAVGGVMQGIEKQGYLASFLIQDGLGMTLPRVCTGFNRDREITGKYNVQEGLEVFGREALTGPYMIAVAPAVLWITKRFCKSTNTNTRLIKRFGENLKTFLNEKPSAKNITEAATLKKEFSKYNLEKFYKETVPNDLEPKETVDLIVKEFEKIGSSDKKEREEALEKIVNTINEKMMENSPELYHSNKLCVGEKNTKKFFDSKEVLTALNDFCDDAILKNKDFAKLDETAADNIKNNFATKRLLTNLTNVALTLGGLAVLPKIYAKSDVAPGAATLQHIKDQQNKENNNTQSDITFKGKGINSDGLFARFGKFLTKNVPEKFNELFEYAGYNFSKSTFASLSIFGLLAPRGKRAWDRAQVDENGKRDMTEINEILLRDTISSLSVVFAVPLLTKGFVSAYENNLGFILTNKASANKNIFKKFIDIINPYSKLEVLSIAELDSIYGNIDSKSKLMNFAKFIEKNGGDLEKILSKSEDASVLFNEKTFTLKSIESLSRADKNKKIIEVFEKIEATDPKAKNEVITKLMKGSDKAKRSTIAQVARGLNSLPGAISTFIISPILLGVLIPMLTYHNTRKAHEKMQKENVA